jgi:flavin reductase (DIM6/NTAB) family NADH-FMN oxidoreductase RutF
MQFLHSDIESLEKHYRTQLINSLSGFKSANLVATINSSGQTNLAVFTSVVHLGADPALYGFISRPNSVPRHTIENIKDTGFYTINHITAEIIEPAHQTSARYTRNESEFDSTGLTVEWHAAFAAPFVQQSRIQLGLEYRDSMRIDLNGTDLVIGELGFINIKDDVIGSDGYVDIEQAGSITVSGLDSYHSTRKLASFSYAKPGRKLQRIRVEK